MPVGTRAAVKASRIDDVRALGAEIVLANTYHLHLRPGDELIARAGGLHAFMGWERPILTDSGGYQVFSLAGRRTLSEEGVVFQSHLDGQPCSLTPESAADIQARLGSDVAMMFDECPSWPATHDEATRRWRARCAGRGAGAIGFWRSAPAASPTCCVRTPGQAQFGIIQGGTYPDLRDRSVAGTLDVGFEATRSAGSRSASPSRSCTTSSAHTAAQLPEDRPRYLMGTGMPDDLVESVARGIDMFDCVLPTRNARNGQLFTRQRADLHQERPVCRGPRPPDPDCACPTCRRHSRAYLAASVHGGRDDRRPPLTRCTICTFTLTP